MRKKKLIKEHRQQKAYFKKPFTWPAIIFTIHCSPWHLSEFQNKNKCEYIKWSRNCSTLLTHSPQTKVHSLDESQRWGVTPLCAMMFTSLSENRDPSECSCSWKTLLCALSWSGVLSSLKCACKSCKKCYWATLCFCFYRGLNIHKELLSTSADKTFILKWCLWHWSEEFGTAPSGTLPHELNVWNCLIAVNLTCLCNC